MSRYVFEARDGSTIEVDASMHNAPPIGSRRQRGGKTYWRVLSLPQARVRPNYHIESHSLPRHWPYAKRHAPDGKPRFDSHREIQEAVARASHTEHDAVQHGEL